MSIQAVAWALKVRTGSPTLKAVLIAIANYADEEGLCWPSQERLMHDAEVSERSVRDALKRLEEMGILAREHRYGEGYHRRSDMIRLNYRQQVPVELPANDARTTGKSCQNYRQELPDKNHQRTIKEPSPSPAGKPAKATVKPIYSDDFVMLWEMVPKADNPGSKSDAAKAFNRLTQADQDACIQGWMAYLDWLEEKRRSRADWPIKHCVTFINQRYWETVLEAQEARHG